MPVDPATAFALFSRDYFVMAFLGSLGTLQIAVARGGYRGLYLLPWRAASRIVGVLLILAAVLYFFLAPLWVDGPWAAGSVDADSATRQWGTADWRDLGRARNVNDVDGGLAGAHQALWFPPAAGLALLLSMSTGFVGMKLRSRAAGRRTAEAELEPSPGLSGLDALKDGDFQGALGRSVSDLRRSLPADAAEAWRESPSWSIPRLIGRGLRR